MPPSTAPATPDMEKCVGCRVQKIFYVERSNNKKRTRQLFHGRVVAFDEDTSHYHIVYEDDDSEDVTWDELKTIMVAEISHGEEASHESKGEGKDAKHPARVVTPGDASKDDCDNDRSPCLSSPRRPSRRTRRRLNYAEESDNEGDGNDDQKEQPNAFPKEEEIIEIDDDDEFVVQEEDTEMGDEEEPTIEENLDVEDMKMEDKESAVETANKEEDREVDLLEYHEAEAEDSKPKAQPQTKNKTKKTPAKTGKKTAPTGSRKTQKKRNEQESVSPRSIAARGLPQGSRAVGRGGFEVRSLDGVPPLLTMESVAKAVKLVSTGQHQAAARLLHTEHHSIQAFCQAASTRLGIPKPASTTLQGGSPLSENAKERLEQGLVSVNAELPGRLLVVRAGTALVESRESGGNAGKPKVRPLCPPELEGRVFESAQALHAELESDELMATFAMDAMGDPAFGPWSVLVQRLASAGLLPVSSEGGDNSKASRKQPFVVEIHWDGSPNTLPNGSWTVYRPEIMKEKEDDDLFRWGLLEGATQDSPPVIVGVSSILVARGDEAATTDSQATQVDPSSNDRTIGLLPQLSPTVAKVRLPASLLQKAIRRNFCSPAPVLEACWALLGNQNNAPIGGAFEMLTTTWRGMLEDASPFDAPEDASMLGLEQLLLLSLVACVDTEWTLPRSLLLKAVATALRTQQQPASFANIDQTPDANDSSNEVDWSFRTGTGRAVELQNALLVMRAVVGGKIVQRSSFEKTLSISETEASLIRNFEQGLPLPKPEPRLQNLDRECRLAAYDPQVTPNCLLLLQATLRRVPVSWKKYSLPAIAKQVQFLISQVNARMPDHHHLTRIAAWGRNANSTRIQPTKVSDKIYQTAREAVTSTGTLSEKELEIIDCFEAVQNFRGPASLASGAHVANPKQNDDASLPRFRRANTGQAASVFDGRMAFLLAFAKAEEVEVVVDDENKKPTSEVVNVLFCGDANDPLLVQRIGKAREEAAATSAGPEAGSSGAKAVPSLGYVQRSRSKKDRMFVEAAERAVAMIWQGGRTVSLPLPPSGFQWSLPTDMTLGNKADEEAIEKTVELTATLVKPGSWKFSIGGVNVEPFDARPVISACSLNTQNHKPVRLGLELEHLLRTALYITDDCRPETVLHAVSRLHELALEARAAKGGVDEGLVYDWLPLAASGKLTATIWRDAILALKTREKDDVVLGPVLSDGTCKRDLTEGCVYRIYSMLECLYPTVLFKTGALRWTVRPRGAGYHHMVDCLEQLSRQSVNIGVDAIFSAASSKSDGCTAAEPSGSKPRKRTRRTAAVVSCPNAENDTKSAGEAQESGVGGNDIGSLPLPTVTTKLWPHQEASVCKVVEGVSQGRRGHADASAVGAGKTLTALGVIARLAVFMESKNLKRNGVLVMLPTKALIKEWLLQIAEHTSGFHVIEQREDGQLFSLTYGKSTPPIDASSLILTTLDRVRVHPFRKTAAWDFVVIDECLAVQNAAAKRCPSAWRQVEISTLGVLMLSATFFRSKYSDLFYMIRMLRTPFPRSMEWLSTTIHEHIVCQVPETNRNWTMRGEPVPLPAADLAEYRGIIEAFKRKQLNQSGETKDFRRLFSDLEAFLRRKYEGRENKVSYSETSVMANAFVKVCENLLKQGKRPLVFADTANEAKHIQGVLCKRGINAREWSCVARDSIVKSKVETNANGVIVAVKSIEGQGINMQHHADAIVARPTPGDLLEQMKGRVDRPGQRSKSLVLTVIMAEHTIEEVKFANIHLAGNFFREFIAPVAHRYRERIDLEATLAAGGSTRLKTGTVSGTWKKSLEAAGRSGAFASVGVAGSGDGDCEEQTKDDESTTNMSSQGSAKRARIVRQKSSNPEEGETNEAQDDGGEPKFASRNKVFRNKGDPEAVRQAKVMAKNGMASHAVRQWLFPPKKPKTGGLPKVSLKRFSDTKPPVVLNSKTIHKAMDHLSKDSVLGKIIARVGADALIQDCGDPKPPTQAGLFDSCVRAITFTMVSVDAGNAFMRKFAIKVGVCVERMKPEKRQDVLKLTLKQMQESGMDCDGWKEDQLLGLLLAGKGQDVLFTPELVGALVDTCIILKGKRSGYPHLCGESYPCGKNDDHEIFLQKAREHGSTQVSVSYSAAKAGFIISLVDDFKSKRFSAEKIAKASDREAAAMLLGLKGIGDWCVGSVLMNKLNRADICQYGDLTFRNGLNDLFQINHNEESETQLESAADFPDTAENRNLIDALATKNAWRPYRSIITLLMYHLQEENLVLV